MGPIKKQKVNKSPSANEKQKKKPINMVEAVVSGQLKKKIQKKQQKPQRDHKGIVFIKHLPHGFFEDQLKKYFEQFGDVTRLRLARSRRTGNSKGYAFVEFEYPEVAEVVAQTMDNYLMFKQIVKASYIPPEKQRYNYFRTSVKQIRNKSGKLVWVSGKTASIQHKMKSHNDWSEEKYQKRKQKQLKKLKKLGENYAHLGIDVNELMVHPEVKTENETLAEISVVSEPKIETTTLNSKAKKRKTNENAHSKQQNINKLKDQVSLKDLLADTLQEDSEDEDYIAKSNTEEETEESQESSDEESYGFLKDSHTLEDSPKHGESAEEPSPIIQRNAKKNFGKTLKTSGVDRFDQMIRRKPQTGGISKLNKKSTLQTSTVTKNKKALQLTDAKDLAKPLSKIREKLHKPLKSKTKVNKRK